MASIVNITYNDKALDSIFRTVRADIEQIKNNARKDIKTVICKLACDLEGIVTLEEVGLTIKNGLKGLVSARFVDMCLDAKYKKEYRVQNARKRLKQSNLAEVLLLESHSRCSRCKDLHLKIEELESALAKTSQPRNLEVIEIEFHLDLGVVQGYMMNLPQQLESGSQLWFNVKIEKTSGKVISATTGRIAELLLPKKSADQHELI